MELSLCGCLHVAFEYCFQVFDVKHFSEYQCQAFKSHLHMIVFFKCTCIYSLILCRILYCYFKVVCGLIGHVVCSLIFFLFGVFLDHFPTSVTEHIRSMETRLKPLLVSKEKLSEEDVERLGKRDHDTYPPNIFS